MFCLPLRLCLPLFTNYSLVRGLTLAKKGNFQGSQSRPCDLFFFRCGRFFQFFVKDRDGKYGEDQVEGKGRGERRKKNQDGGKIIALSTKFTQKLFFLSATFSHKIDSLWKNLTFQLAHTHARTKNRSQNAFSSAFHGKYLQHRATRRKFSKSPPQQKIRRRHFQSKNQHATSKFGDFSSIFKLFYYTTKRALALLHRDDEEISEKRRRLAFFSRSDTRAHVT